MRQVLKLTESEFRNYIQDMISESIQEGIWDNFKTGAKTFAKNLSSGSDLSTSWNNAKSNYHLQGETDEAKKLLSDLKKYVEENNIPLDTTIQEILGGGNGRFGKLQGKIGNRISRMKKNGL